MNDQKAIIIGAWFNENAATNKVTIIATCPPMSLDSTALSPEAKMRIAASGNEITPKDIRAIFPITEKKAVKCGINVEALSRDAKNPTLFDKPMSGKDIFGWDVGIQVVETTELRPGSNPEKVRKMNPSTGELMTQEGQQIYRYADLLPLQTIEDHITLVSDQTLARQATSAQS